VTSRRLRPPRWRRPGLPVRRTPVGFGRLLASAGSWFRPAVCGWQSLSSGGHFRPAVTSGDGHFRATVVLSGGRLRAANGAAYERTRSGIPDLPGFGRRGRGCSVRWRPCFTAGSVAQRLRAPAKAPPLGRFASASGHRFRIPAARSAPSGARRAIRNPMRAVHGRFFVYRHMPSGVLRRAKSLQPVAAFVVWVLRVPNCGAAPTTRTRYTPVAAPSDPGATSRHAGHPCLRESGGPGKGGVLGSGGGHMGAGPGQTLKSGQSPREELRGIPTVRRSREALEKPRSRPTTWGER